MEDFRNESRKLQVQGELGTSRARKQPCVQRLMGPCQKDPGTSVNCDPLTKLGDNFSIKIMIIMVMDYNTLNLKKEIIHLW